MSQVTVAVDFNAETGTVKFSLDLQGNTELEHELLAAAIGTGRTVSLTPAHKANELFAEFTIADKSIWPRALRGFENRRRIADGQPTVEEEEAQAERRAAAEKQADKDAAAAQKQAAIDSAAAKQKEDDRLVGVLKQALGK